MMFGKDMLPINVVEGDGFRELIHFIIPDFIIPSRVTITGLLQESYGKKK